MEDTILEDASGTRCHNNTGILSNSKTYYWFGQHAS